MTPNGKNDDSHAGRSAISAMYRTISTAWGLAGEEGPLTRASLGLAWEFTFYLTSYFDLFYFIVFFLLGIEYTYIVLLVVVYLYYVSSKFVLIVLLSFSCMYVSLSINSWHYWRLHSPPLSSRNFPANDKKCAWWRRLTPTRKTPYFVPAPASSRALH